MLVPTQRHGKNVGTRIARPCLRSKQSPGRAIPPALRRYATLDLPAANCIRSECRTSNARPYAASREECRDEHRSSAFAKQTIARQGDPPALRRYGTLDLPAAHDGNVLRPSCVEENATLDLPAANCIRSECRTSNARPYVSIETLPRASPPLSTINC